MLNKIFTSRVPSRQEGATAVEYGLIAGLIAVAIVGVLMLIGPKLNTTFTNVSNGLTSANSTGS